ncbi:MAG: PepSY domain-containing protein [Alkalispirochaeta sp.]
MGKKKRMMLLTGILVVGGWSGIWALTPERINEAVEIGVATEGDAVALSVQSSWDDLIIAIELDNGWEVYVSPSSGEVLRRERDLVRRKDRLMAAAVRNGQLMTLGNAWALILDQLRASERYDWVTTTDLHSIEYDREFRRAVVEAELRVGGGRDRLRVYADAATGEILEVEHDD